MWVCFVSFGWVNIMPVNVEGCVGVVLWSGLIMFNGFKERGCDCCVRGIRGYDFGVCDDSCEGMGVDESAEM